MPTPELFKYFPHDLPVLHACFYYEDVITLTSSTIYFWSRPGGLEADYIDFRLRLDVEAVDFALHDDTAYVLGADGSVTVLAIDVSVVKANQPYNYEAIIGVTPFRVTYAIKFDQSYANGIEIAIFKGYLFVLLSSGVIAICPLDNLRVEASTLYTFGKPKKLVTFALSDYFLFVVAKADTKVFRTAGNAEIVPYGYLSRDISKPDISLRNTTCLKFDNSLLVQTDAQGHFSLWKFSEEQQFYHLFTQWQHGSSITSLAVDFDRLIGIGMDREGCGVIYSLRKSEVLERWVLHSGKVNSSELRGGRLLTASADFTAKIWLLWK